MSGRKRVGQVVPVVVAVASVAVGIHMFMDGDRGPSPTRKDTERLRRIVRAVRAAGSVPMRDGVFDPYELVRQGEIGRDELDVFTSARSKSGPTAEEIERGDYTNFPWERGRRGGDPATARFPLLWEKAPDRRGWVLTALSDGTVVILDRDEFRAALEGQ